jgi:predicted negative regulator of RcsB-dependent stress response
LIGSDQSDGICTPWGHHELPERNLKAHWRRTVVIIVVIIILAMLLYSGLKWMGYR